MTNGLIQHITVEESTGIQWVKHCMLSISTTLPPHLQGETGCTCMLLNFFFSILLERKSKRLSRKIFYIVMTVGSLY